MSKPTILLTDDDRDILETHKFLLSDEYEVETASSVSEAKGILYNKDIEVAVVDLNFEGQEQDGLHLIDYINESLSSVPVIVLSSDNDTKRVVEAMRRPLVDFVTKDEDSEGAIRSAITQSLAKKKAHNADTFFEYKTESPKMVKLLRKVDQVLASGSSAPILILGESGTGKEFLAKYVSSRLGKKLVAANMASIPKEMAESELFGHKKGSFTGATQDKAGLLDQAHDGVFFLDELGDCSLAIQAKLLRVIQEKEVLPVGGLSPRKINLRFVAATHKDLENMIKSEDFRLDLYQRLNTFTFTIPALRERPEDIEFYTRMFVNELTQGDFFRIVPEGIEELKRHSWPGNVRELRNVIERIIVYSRRRSLDPEIVQQAISGPASTGEYTSSVKSYTREDVIQALEKTNGNRMKAAKLLDVHKSTLHRWIAKFGLAELVKSNGAGRPPSHSLQVSKESYGKA